MENHDFYPEKPELVEKKIEKNTAKTVLSILLFIIALNFVGISDFSFIFFVIMVIFIHEIGHFSFMKLFKYKNVSMMFIPLMGAFVKGQKDNYEQKQSILVVMAGPIPGIILGMILLYFGTVLKMEWMFNLSLLFLFLNLTNLLPLDPLDGGQLFRLLINKGHELFQLVFSFISSLIVIGIGWYFNAWGIIIFGFLMGFRVRAIQKNYQIHKDLAEENVNFKTTYKLLSNKDFSKIKQVVLNYTPALRTYMNQVESEVVDPVVASQVNSVLVSPFDKNASFLFKFITVLIWLLAFISPLLLVIYLKLIEL